MAGRFITFEGIEGCGKSTQLHMLADRLRAEGHAVTTSREPGGSAIGDAIRSILLDPNNKEMVPLTEILLYAASRAQHCAQIIAPALAKGHMVLVDRFADSTRAYQGAARALPVAIVDQLEVIATQGLMPELTIIPDITVATSTQRLTKRGTAKDRLEQEAQDFHERVRQGYLDLAKTQPERVKQVDGSLDEKTVHEAIWKIVSG